MATYRHTGVGNATARTDYASAGQAQDSSLIWCGTAGGTADALTLTPTPSVTSYTAGRVFRFKSGASPNTGAATVQISGIATPRAIQWQGAALVAGNIAANTWYELLDDGTALQLLNPVLKSLNGLNVTATTGTFTLSNGKTLTVSGTLTLAGTDGKTLTVSNSLTLAGTDGKTLTVNENLTLTGTTGTTITFQATDTYVGRATTDTLTNKRVTARVGSTTSHATPTINTDNVDVYKLTAQTEAITSFTTNLSGTPTDAQVLVIQITGTASRAITWGASFESSTVTLPTTTVSTNMLTVGFLWNAVSSKWRCVASV